MLQIQVILIIAKFARSVTEAVFIITLSNYHIITLIIYEEVFIDCLFICPV